MMGQFYTIQRKFSLFQPKLIIWPIMQWATGLIFVSNENLKPSDQILHIILLYFAYHIIDIIHKWIDMGMYFHNYHH